MTAVSRVEVLVEEPSMEAALRALLPRLLGDLSFEIYRHQCKDDLLTRLPDRLRGYASWLPADWRIVVVVDRDNDDCRKLKQQMDKIACDAGLRSRSSARDQQYQVVNRLAIEELEAWYFGDWDAVRAAYPKVPKAIPNKATFRDPDAIPNGTWETFERILMRSGYFQTGLRKIEAARSISAHWQPELNRSRSFQVFCDVLRDMTA
jgi:hypothetical protein